MPESRWRVLPWQIYVIYKREEKTLSKWQRDASTGYKHRGVWKPVMEVKAQSPWGAANSARFFGHYAGRLRALPSWEEVQAPAGHTSQEIVCSFFALTRTKKAVIKGRSNSKLRLVGA